MASIEESEVIDIDLMEETIVDSNFCQEAISNSESHCFVAVHIGTILELYST